jgi:predicted Zn-dependent protease
VLGHEITHVTAKHTVHAIEKNKVISMGAQEAGGRPV